MNPDELTRQQRWNAVEEILNFAENHERRRKKSGLGTFLQELALDGNDDRTEEDEDRRNHVTLMTLHTRVEEMGCMGGCMGWAFKGMFKKMIRKDHAALKAWIEAQ